jgi:hypothetical protein
MDVYSRTFSSLRNRDQTTVLFSGLDLKFNSCYKALVWVSQKQENRFKIMPIDQSFSPGEYCGLFHFIFWYYGSWINVVVDE